jgi:hypothetical protein
MRRSIHSQRIENIAKVGNKFRCSNHGDTQSGFVAPRAAAPANPLKILVDHDLEEALQQILQRMAASKILPGQADKTPRGVSVNLRR